MTNLGTEDIVELEYAEKNNLEPGFFAGYILNNKMVRCYEKYLDQHNQQHRWTGPAIKGLINGAGDFWYIHGKRLDCQTQKEFELIRDRLYKLKAFW